MRIQHRSSLHHHGNMGLLSKGSSTLYGGFSVGLTVSLYVYSLP
jgi:hypothetical protein